MSYPPAARTLDRRNLGPRLQEHADLMSAALEERSTGAVSARDVFLPHGLDGESVQAIGEALRRHRDVASAFLIRKQVKILPARPRRGP